MWWPSETSKFAFAESIHDVTGAFFSSNSKAAHPANSNAASLADAGKPAGLADPDLPDWDCVCRAGAAALDSARLVPSRPGRADGAFKSPERHSEPFGGHDDQSRPARVALVVCAG